MLVHAAILATASAAALLSAASLPQTPPAFRRQAVWCRSSVPVASEGGPPTPADIRWVPPINPNAGDVEPADGCATRPAATFFSSRASRDTTRKPLSSLSRASGRSATVMPLFPLGVTYLPYTQPVLNIFEPRYRQMYNDILFSGARRFMVCNVDTDTGRVLARPALPYHPVALCPT